MVPSLPRQDVPTAFNQTVVAQNQNPKSIIITIASNALGESESCTAPIGWKRAVVCIESKSAKRLPQRPSVLITLARVHANCHASTNTPSLSSPDHADLRSVILCQSSLHMNSFVFASCQRFISVYVP